MRRYGWLMAVLLAGCQANTGPAEAPQASLTAEALAGQRWDLVRINEEKVKRGAWMQFDAAKAQVHGSSGCNQYFGQAAYDGEVLRLGNLAGTRRLCPDMALEDQFLRVFQHDFKVAEVDGQLRLTGTQSGQVMYFTPSVMP